MPGSQNHPVLFFDGVCNLCNGTVQFIIRHDKKGIFRFAPLQSPKGVDTLTALSSDHKVAPDSIILLEDGKYYTRSTAALRIAKRLGGIFPLLYILIVIPPFIRDGVYGFIARNRYNWFGKRNECMIPTPELKERFLT